MPLAGLPGCSVHPSVLTPAAAAASITRRNDARTSFPVYLVIVTPPKSQSVLCASRLGLSCCVPRLDHESSPSGTVPGPCHLLVRIRFHPLPSAAWPNPLSCVPLASPTLHACPATHNPLVVNVV